MKRPLFSRSRLVKSPRDGERGITMALVAICMVAILAMAVLSIDTVTLYLAREEAQRSADAAALAGARILSLSGMTGGDCSLWGQSGNRGEGPAPEPALVLRPHLGQDQQRGRGQRYGRGVQS